MQTGKHTVGILHIVVDGLLNLLLALWSVDGLGSALRDIARAIEFRTLPTQSQLVQWDAFTLESGDADVFWHNRVTAADTSETCRL